MSPEERAKDLISLLRVDGSWGDWSDGELEALIASAIRQAQASARNEALEEALREIAMTTLANIDEASPAFMAALAFAQERIAFLKTKD